MNIKFNLLAAGVLALATADNTAGTVRYVDVNSASPTPPYTNWTTAARIIQDAVDAAGAGDEIVVTNGTYATGGRTLYGNNRVLVDKPLALRSVNGPQFTVIHGYTVPDELGGWLGTGDQAIRCVYLARAATLSGFTLTNGATRSRWDYSRTEQRGGGLCCEPGAAASNCVLAVNSAQKGGGACGGTLNNCILTGNSAIEGGGVYEGALNNCTLTSNAAYNYGGGAEGSTLNNCTLIGNRANVHGGGGYDSTLTRCVLTGNSAGGDGGAALGGTLNNCRLSGNSAVEGGGAVGSALNNCTLTGNWAANAGGACSATLNNCIIYYNTAADAPNCDDSSVLRYCCTAPLPTNGVGNISLDPQLASGSHLSAASPCRGAGSAAYATGTDIDGETWAIPPAIGCDEYRAGALTGGLSVALLLDYTNVASGYAVSLTALIEGRTAASVWDFGDGIVLSNRPYATHTWTVQGDYGVVLRAYNDSHAEGVSAAVAVHVFAQPVHCVDAGSANPVPPYMSWATAARNIQDAVDVAALGGTVLVTNGTYVAGGRAVWGTMTNRVAVDKQVVVRSVNGPLFTLIKGHQLPETTNGNGAIRCVYLTNGACLAGFTLTGGATRDSQADYAQQCGGGVWCQSEGSVVSNCVLVGNSAYAVGGGAFGGTLSGCSLTTNRAVSGGGAYAGELNNCTLTGNSAVDYGGGAYEGALNNCALTANRSGHDGGGVYHAALNNCTLTGNTADIGGAASFSTLGNCTLTANTAQLMAGGAYESTLNYCTLAGNYSQRNGGGAAYCTANNCKLTDNSAFDYGGGAIGGTLNNCTLTDNSANLNGGGVIGGTLNNCTLTGNSAWDGGGAIGTGFGDDHCVLNNCIVYMNTARYSFGDENYDAYCILNYCCTTPLPSGVGNISDLPLFVDYAEDNLRLHSNSPCINAGNNACVQGNADLDVNLRIAGGTVDIGAYEFQGEDTSAFSTWLEYYGLPADGSADYIDSDRDGLNNWQEWRCRTNPTNALSALRLLSASLAGTHVSVTWQSVTGVRYSLERSTNLAATQPFTALATNLPGELGATTYIDTNAAGLVPLFYRVGVNTP